MVFVFTGALSRIAANSWLCGTSNFLWSTLMIIRTSSSPFTELWVIWKRTSLDFTSHSCTKRTKTTSASPSLVVPSKIIPTSLPFNSFSKDLYSSSDMNGISWCIFHEDDRLMPASSKIFLKNSTRLRGVPLFKNAWTTFMRKTLVGVERVSPLGGVLGRISEEPVQCLLLACRSSSASLC